MKEYDASKIRNICLLAHGGAGKTTFAEAALFCAGAADRLGKVSDGTTTADYDPEEIKRKISINLAMAPVEWGTCKVNIIDTPGFFDFVGEVRQGARAAESGLILVSAKDGVAVGTEKSWGYCNDDKLARMFFINRMDDENADFEKTLSQITEAFGSSVVPFQLPIIEGDKMIGQVDVISKTAIRFGKDGSSSKEPIPAALESRVSDIWENLKEMIAESSEALMEKYFGGEEFTDAEAADGIRAGVASMSIAPVFLGASAQNIGVKPALDGIVRYMPDAAAKGAVKAQKDGGGDITVNPVATEPTAALVFKTIADPFVGKISIFRVYSGVVRADSLLYNAALEKNEKIAQLFIMRGKKQIPADKIVAGDIGAVAKLAGTNTGDTLSDPARKVVLPKIAFPTPCISLAVEAKAKGDEEKISSGLQRLQDEDLTFKVALNAETKQMVISGMGEQHLDVIVSKLKAKFNVGVNLLDPKVPYRETIRKKIKIEGKHKKQTGGHGQYGHVWMEFEPGETDEVEFTEKIFGGSVPKQYFPAVEKGLREAATKGVLAGYPVVRLKATLVDGSYHDVDSSEQAFKTATRKAYKTGLPQASPVILEPIDHIEVLIPDGNMGDIIGDLNKRRGRIMGMEPQTGGFQLVLAEAPAAEMFKYANDLRAMTQGRGSFSERFERYEQAPEHVAQKIVESAKKDMEADDEDE